MSKNFFEKDNDKKVGYCVSKTAQYLKFSAINMIKRLGLNDALTLDQYEVLFVLLESDGLYQRQLGHMLLKDRPNTTRLINILEEKGLIARKPDPDNKRKQRIFITEQGKLRVNDLAPLKDNMQDKVLKGISIEELDVMLKTLEKIRNNLQDDFTMQT